MCCFDRVELRAVSWKAVLSSSFFTIVASVALIVALLARAVFWRVFFPPWLLCLVDCWYPQLVSCLLPYAETSLPWKCVLVFVYGVKKMGQTMLHDFFEVLSKQFITADVFFWFAGSCVSQLLCFLFCGPLENILVGVLLMRKTENKHEAP